MEPVKKTDKEVDKETVKEADKETGKETPKEADKEMPKAADRKRILAVDDVAIILQRIMDALDKYYEVIPVSSGARALRYLEREKPDLILLDIRMAPKDGFQTLREIRTMKDRADIPVIMLTAMEGVDSVMQGIKLGIRGYILKPFVPEDLLERVQKVLGPVSKDDAQA